MRMETFIRKSLGLKADTVVKVEELPKGGLLAQVDRLGARKLRCGEYGLPSAKVARTRRPARRWRDLALRDRGLWLAYAPHRVWCRTCGLRVEKFPWADKWQLVTHALFQAVASLARKLDWAAVAGHFHLNWKTVEHYNFLQTFASASRPLHSLGGKRGTAAQSLSLQGTSEAGRPVSEEGDECTPARNPSSDAGELLHGHSAHYVF